MIVGGNHRRPTPVLPGLRLLVLATLALPAPAAAQSGTQDRSDLFDRGDRRSRLLMETRNCASEAATARRAGVLGPPDSLGAEGQCEYRGSHRLGIYLDADSLYSRARRFAAVDLTTRTRWLAPLDTVRALAMARARAAAIAAGHPRFAALKRQYAPFAFRFDGDSIEAWLVPVALLRGIPAAVGGELGYVFDPDGRIIVRTIDATEAFRPLVVPETGEVIMTSQEAAVPNMSEFFISNLLNRLGRTVRIELRTEQATLIGTGTRAMWIRTKTTPPTDTLERCIDALRMEVPALGGSRVWCDRARGPRSGN